MTRVSSTAPTKEVQKSSVSKKILKKKNESKKHQKVTKRETDSLEAINDELHNVFQALQNSFNILFPQLCKHDQITAKLLWDRALSAPNNGSTLSNFPPICGCNEN